MSATLAANRKFRRTHYINDCCSLSDRDIWPLDIVHLLMTKGIKTFIANGLGEIVPYAP